jgi:hypothetical protein
MARRDRVQVTVSPEMSIALDCLSERTGLSVAAQCMVLLRQSLDRTISSDAVQKRLRAHRAYRTSQEWQAETMTTRAVELALERFGPATEEEARHGS